MCLPKNVCLQKSARLKNKCLPAKKQLPAIILAGLIFCSNFEAISIHSAT
jgi:hypothetical protein